MTYHRTTGKGGTVNRGRDPKLPNFNKNQGATGNPRHVKTTVPKGSVARGK
jgi:hypothetical protein